jgi:hypothetical protein
MSFTGLVWSERSAEWRRRGSITKAGDTPPQAAAGRGGLERPSSPPRSATSPPAATAARIPPSSSAPGAASSACSSAGGGWPPGGKPTRRSLSPAPAELAGFVWAIASDQPLRPAARADEDLSSRCRPTSRRTLDTSMRPAPAVTRDPRPRQLPTVPSHAVPTGESESDAPSLPWAVRCSRPRGGPPQPSREQPQAVG